MCSGNARLEQLHSEYSVLDWPNLRLSRKVRRLVRRGVLRDRGRHLRMTDEINAVCMGIRRAYGDGAWLTPRYAQLLDDVRCESPQRIQTLATELRDGDERLIGGEIFLDRDAPAVNHYGKVQLAALGKVLEQCGYAFWNLGEPTLPYKADLGANRTPRPEFLARWREAILREPACELTNLAGRSLCCHALLRGEW